MNRESTQLIGNKLRTFTISYCALLHAISYCELRQLIVLDFFLGTYNCVDFTRPSNVNLLDNI